MRIYIEDSQGTKDFMELPDGSYSISDIENKLIQELASSYIPMLNPHEITLYREGSTLTYGDALNAEDSLSTQELHVFIQVPLKKIDTQPILDRAVFSLKNIYEELKTQLHEHESEQALEMAAMAWDHLLSDLITQLEKDFQLDRKSPLFKSIIAKAVQQVMVILDLPERNTELLLLLKSDEEGTEVDEDLAKVLQMRFAMAAEKGFGFFPLNDEFTEILGTQKGVIFNNITKLSFLHHWSVDMYTKEDWNTNKIIKHVGHIVQTTPQLNEIVLRGCCSASLPQHIKKALSTEKKIEIVSINRNIDNEKCGPDKILFQQVQKNQELITRLRFLDALGKEVTRELRNIPPNPAGNKLTEEVESALAQIAYKENLPLMSLESQRKKAVTLKGFWKGKGMSPDEKLFTKTMLKNLRTFSLDSLYEESLAFKVQAELIKIGRNKITIKGYVHCYEASKSGVIGYEHAPKSIKSP